ncbi:hypothetical protein QQS21_010223 [Conoideocrella luteorostrata]|uniref:Uncharacterized protein n=1 Tax=Conoideocrella luteorostrata TaxID=1105319 RepID=A0AAJ0CI44_9HYPO|nr:hypothetical protein QQS21_010223 [Conoideocrella luteorostrata]
MADTQSRSNSLQRMLDLEKQYMFERLHPQPAQLNSKSQPTAASGSQTSSPDRTSIQVRRAEGIAQKYQGKSGDGRRDTSLPPQLPPLMINTGTPLTMSRSDLFMGRGRELPSADGVSSAASTPREKHTKVVAFEFPPKEAEAAQCYSPSWEAYERRRSEKKMEKKEREESKKEGIKRLSKKPPPPSSPKSLQQALASETDAGRGRRRERAETTAAMSSPNKEPKPARKARSRSGSFVSMLRAPFEFRRSSVEQGNDSGFIGGIKLELQRHAAQQQVLDTDAVEDDESHIHPALRKGKSQEIMSSSALKSPPPPPRAGGPDEAGNQRRYPPITRGNNIRHQKSMSLISPTAPAIPDLSKIDKWRARVGLKAGSRPESRMDRDRDAQPGGTAIGAITEQRKQSSLPRAVNGPREQPKPSVTSPRKPMHIAYAAGASPTQSTNFQQKSDDTRRPQHHSNNESVSSMSSEATGYKTAPSSPAPPEPPRRSSKRSSVLSLDGSIPPMPPLPSPNQQQQLNVQSSPRHVGPSAQRSFPLCKSAARSAAAQAKDCQSAKVATTASPASRYVSAPTYNGHVPTSSSDDSGSDDFRSTSCVSTPATSRPQSEREMSLVSSKGDTSTPDDKAAKSRLSTTYPVQSEDNSEEEMDPIQAAAEKVLAVFNGIPVQKPGLRGRCNSQSSLATDASFEPSLKERPLKLRPKSKPLTQTLQNMSAPASYLQDARKQPPAVTPVRVHKKRFGPPASFILPDDDGSDTATDDAQKLESYVPDTVGRSQRHKSTPLLSSSDREPISKVFVECCSCKHYHDMPSKLYEAMANPGGTLSSADKYGFCGALSMTVQCSWCKHEMSIRCCAGLASTLYIKERLH